MFKIRNFNLYRCDLDHSPRRTGSTPSNAILGLWEDSQYCYTTVVGVMSQCQFLTGLGVLPKVLYHCSGSSPTKVI